jgi:uncharacterized alpha-E superfamily protein
MLSRVADAIYWASRYVERAENVARFVNVNLDLMLETPSTQRPSWEPLVLTTGDQDWFNEHYKHPTPESVTHFLSFDKRYPNSVVSAVSLARENARTVREAISREMWQELNDLYLMVKDASRNPGPVEEMAEYFERVKMAGIHYAGVTDATLSHGKAWHFSRLGRLLERADKTSRILDVKYFVLLPSVKDVGSAIDQVGWTALLNSASALQMYRQTEHVISPSQVARFLLLNDEFPRSIRHCVRQSQLSLHELTGTPIGHYSTEAERLLGKLMADLDYTDIDEVMESGLHEYLDQLQTTLNAVSTSVQAGFFEHPDN